MHDATTHVIDGTARMRAMAKTILITGASSGLGAEMARQFAHLGHDLALCARRTDLLEELRTEVLTKHPDRRVAIRALDVTDDDAVFRCSASSSRSSAPSTGSW
jgi:short-subunit dehydrogenase